MTNIDDRIALVKKLIAQREEIDRQLFELLGGEPADRKERRCSVCHDTGHQARTCPTKNGSAGAATA